MNPSHKAIGKPQEIMRALWIKESLGTRFAAGYLRARGWSLEAATYLLATRQNARFFQ